MGTIDDVRKVIQDLVAPELKALSVQLDSYEREAKLRDEALAQRITATEELLLARLDGLAKEGKLRDEVTHLKLEALSSKTEAQYQSIMFALNLDKRVESLERDKQSASA